LRQQLLISLQLIDLCIRRKGLTPLVLHLHAQCIESAVDFLEAKIMNKSIRLTALAALAAVVSLAPMVADEWDKKTIMHVKEPLQIPGATLQPGDYVFRVLGNLTSDRHTVEVFDNNNHLITTVLAIPNWRLKPTGHTEFAFWEVPAGQPAALRAWFFPGDNMGQEFAYPKNMSAQISAAANTPVPVAEEVQSAPVAAAPVAETPAPVAAVEPAPAPAPAATPELVAAAAPAPEPAAAPAPAPVQEAPAELPHTASSMPLIGLAGLLAMAAAFAVRPARVR
jgi:hypothetical protein